MERCISDEDDGDDEVIWDNSYAKSTCKTIMQEYCRTLDRVNLNELLEFERNLTGEVHIWIPMQAGCDVIVRIKLKGR